MVELMKQSDLGELEPEDRDGTESELDRVRAANGQIYLRVKLDGETKAMLSGHSLYEALKRRNPEKANAMELARLSKTPDRIPDICFNIIEHTYVLQPRFLVSPNMNLNEATDIFYEDVPFGTLEKQIVTEEIQLEDEDILRLAFQLALAIAYCHTNLKIMHRNINSKSIFVYIDPETGRYSLKLGGFIFARRIASDNVHSANPNASLRFSAPETLQSYNGIAIYNYSSDIWSYGMVLDFMAHGGRHPFPQLKTRKALRDALWKSPKPTRPKLVGVSEDLAKLINACLRSEMRDEFGKIDAMESLRPTAVQICDFLNEKGYTYQ